MPAIIKVVDGRTIIKVGENTAMAAASATLSGQYANAAGLSAAAAALAAAAVGVYGTTAEGIGATTNGQSFYVTDGTDFALYENNAGVADLVIPLPTVDAVNARVPYAELASTAPGEGVDLIGTVTSPEIPNPVVLRTILLDAQVSRMLSATGDGDTDPAAVTAETAKFQAMLDTGRSFDVPQPDVTYAVNQLFMGNGQEMRGYGRFGPAYDTQGGEFLFTGNGVDPTIVMGDGTGNPRRQALVGISVINSNAPAVYVDGAPDWVLDRCRVFSGGNTAALRANMSYVASVTNCTIAAGGLGAGTDTWAVDLTDNVNGFTAIGNRVSGGAGGGAFRIGQSYQIALIQNIIESSLHGIWVSSDTNTGGGNCNGVILNGNNFEQCSTPYKLGTAYSVLGLDMSGGYVSNPLTTIIAPRTACIQLGRVRGGKIFGMSLHPHTSEDLFWLWLAVPDANMVDLEVGNNTVTGTPNAAYALKGAYAANVSVMATTGGTNKFDFMGNGDPQGTSHIREWVSPPLNASVTVSNLAWITDAAKALGGRIYSAEVIDYDGGTFGTASIRAGRTASTAESFTTALSALTFNAGVASIPMAPSPILSGSNSTYGVIGDGAATAKFRIKFRYRIN